MIEHTLFVEKYRPQKIDDCILPKELKQTFKDIISTGKIPNMMLAGSAGCGKTTVAKALCSEMGVNCYMINASEQGNIDTLRTTIRNFASSVSLTGGTKVIILDEADYLNPASTQPALRGFMEEFSSNARFILTCNFKNKILPALHSRCTVIDFRLTKEDKPHLAAQFFQRVKYILDTEKIPYQPKAVAELITKHFPDYRRILNEIQRYSHSGKIDEGILLSLGEVHLNDLMKSLKEKDFSTMRKWVVENLDNDPSQIFRKIYDHLYDYLKKESIPQAVVLLADYSYKSGFVSDLEINLVAALTEIMVACEFN